MDGLLEGLVLVGVVAAWVALARWVLPRLGLRVG